MKPSDFFVEEENPEWDLKGLDPWRRTQMVLDTTFYRSPRTAPQQPIDDPDAAYALAQLAHEELAVYGTGGGERLSDEEMAGASAACGLSSGGTTAISGRRSGTLRAFAGTGAATA